MIAADLILHRILLPHLVLVAIPVLGRTAVPAPDFLTTARSYILLTKRVSFVLLIGEGELVARFSDVLERNSRSDRSIPSPQEVGGVLPELSSGRKKKW